MNKTDARHLAHLQPGYKPTRITFARLVKRCGPVKRALDVPDAEWQKAVSEGRFATVYHGENDWCTPLTAMVGHHGYCNTICKILWAKPLPKNYKEIIGMRNSDAWKACNPD